MNGADETLYPGFSTDTGDVAVQLVHPDVAALVVVDVQNDYCHPDGALGRAGYDLSTIDPMCDVIEELIDAAADAAVPVVFLKNVHSEATDSPAWRRKTKHSMQVCREGSWGGEFYRISPRPGDPVVVKHRYSGFIGTRLGQVLAAAGRTTVIITGTATNVCVESTARDAAMLDYDVVVVSDGVGATDPAAHRGTLQNLDRFFGHVVGSEAIRKAWTSWANGEPVTGKGPQ